MNALTNLQTDMAQTQRKSKRSADGGYFGVCPTCGSNDGFVNVGSDHWFICHEHKIRWCVGSDLFEAWRYETEEKCGHNRSWLRTYREIEPFRPLEDLLPADALLVWTK
jgi:hypothetical protein